MKILIPSLIVMAILYALFGLAISFNPIQWSGAEKILFVVCSIIADMGLSKTRRKLKR